MNPRMLELYNQELQHIRESAAEFAREYPKARVPRSSPGNTRKLPGA